MDAYRSVQALLRQGAVLVEMHNEGCREETGCACVVVLVDREGGIHTFRADDADLLEPDLRCVCSEYR